jgi:hypothetical protein
MDEPRDDVDTWLQERVTPLLPPPGSFDQIRKRARRRKLGRAAIAAVGTAAVVAGAITVPRLILGGPVGGTPVAASRSTTPAPQNSPSSAQPTPSGTSGPDASSATPTPTQAPVPPNFAVSSVTFVSTSDGWVLGQAGTPGQCGPPDPYICTSIAATDDGGATWHGVPAPVAGAPDGGAGVSQLRFLDGINGWAFGPQLYATHDGGQTWARIATHGARVIGLETVKGRAFAVWARCTGTGPDFAAHCTRFSLYSTPAGTDAWAPVPGVTGLASHVVPGGAVSPSSAQLALTGERGYLLAPDGQVYSGPVTRATGWAPAAATGTTLAGCGFPGLAQANGVPQNVMLAATGPVLGPGLVELCAGSAPGQPTGKALAYSPDGGHTWAAAGDAPGTAVATSLSGSPAGQVVVATTEGIEVSGAAAGAGGLSWRPVRGASVPGGFSYVGMTTSQQGVAIPADTSLHAVWFTYDGGRHWRESPVR